MRMPGSVDLASSGVEWWLIPQGGPAENELFFGSPGEYSLSTFTAAAHLY